MAAPLSEEVANRSATPLVFKNEFLFFAGVNPSVSTIQSAAKFAAT